jgi:formate hydrogenlyase subunit 3/multisubunit Na+/H+ antiporter MnhD subunit
MITITTALLGIMSSIFTEVVKVFPKIKNNEILTSLTAIIVVGVVAFFANGSLLTFESFIEVLATAFISYKMIVQPVVNQRQLP